jgi:hypothetical protein
MHREDAGMGSELAAEIKRLALRLKASKQPLQWWLVVSLSGLLLAWGWYSGWAATIVAEDRTFIASGIAIAYLLCTGWTGSNLLRGLEPPFAWMEYLASEMPLWGLIGTVIGVILLFGLGHGAGELDREAINAGMGTALFTTLVGAVCSSFLFLQAKVLKNGE